MGIKHSLGNLFIPRNSPLIGRFGIKEGNYRAEIDDDEGKLYLHPKRGETVSLSVTADELLAVLLLVSNRDKFTAEELQMIERIQRSSSFTGTKEFPAHHIIPLECCKKSKLILQAKKCQVFDENNAINRIQLPVDIHSGYHNKYSSFVDDILEDEWAILVEYQLETDCDVIEEKLEFILSYLKEKITEMLARRCKINDI